MVIEAPPTNIFCLPNEILLRSLNTFSTRDLLPLTCVCYRFHDLVLRILYGRLLTAASLSQHKLILESYHPTTKSMEPYLFCDYLGTPGLSSENEGYGLVYQSDENVGRLGKLASLYSRFRPIPLSDEHRIFAPHPAGGPSTQMRERTLHKAESSKVSDSTLPAESSHLVEHAIHLDIDEPFSQLCVMTNLVRLGPRRGVFFNIVHVSEGVVRVKRDWLAKRAKACKLGQTESEQDKTLWMDSHHNIGLMLNVNEKTWTRAAPILMLRDEDPAVSYKVQYQGLLVRTTHLLFAIEKALLQDNDNSSGKAMIFGNFVQSVST